MKKRTWRILISSLVIVGLLIGSVIFLRYHYSSPKDEDKFTATLSSCVDGDTAWFYYGGKEHKTRFLAIDAPEVNPDTNDPEPGALDAQAKTCQLLTDAQKIELAYDSNADQQDKYGRELVWVFVDDQLLQEELVKEGYVEVAYLYGNYRYNTELKQAEREAKENNLGLWK